MILELLENHLFASILVGMLFICTVVLCVYYFRFLKIKINKQPLDLYDQKQPISVVIATRNEHDQLRQNLPFFLNQNYANFEIVVVIDESDKELTYIMDEFEKRHSNLKVVSFEWSRNFFVSHKFAESVGIKSATYDRILVSNITTRPASPEWIARMSRALSGDKKIVIGYHTMTIKPSFINVFVRFDTFFYTLYYLRAALSGHSFTADCKNLAFDRSLFYDTKGIARFYNVNTGDENMFVNKATTKINTAIEIHPDAIVKGQLKPTFGEWFEKTIRRRVLIKEFKKINRVGLFLYDLFMALFYIVSGLIFGCFFLPETSFFDIPMDFLMIAGGLFFLKILIQWIVFKRMMSRFKECGFLLLIPVFDLVKLILLPVLLFIGLFTKRITWK
ncbi:MAG: glycosyltransferase [Bacteroidales bacterium]|jgi:glycosyltransferase involved in cell wall biosynthesis|nr:glycosyltransferase [Bacteroidales bacterium]